MLEVLGLAIVATFFIFGEVIWHWIISRVLIYTSNRLD